MSTSQDAATSSLDRSFFGHPRGLSTLFFTEMWERFSYYGMRAILLLYMTKAFSEGGLALDEKYAGLIYGTYVSSVWYLPLPGGWIADRILGARRAVLIGAIIIACGHYSMAINSKLTFYAGLILIACGTGLLKPNISAMVGQLYSEDDKRRDSGFSIFYTGINLGAFLAPLIVGFLAQSQSFRNVIVKMGLNPNSKLTFYAGLILIACGTGLLKPNISAMVGQLYSEDDKRRDSGFSIFYTGINLGAFLAPLIVGFLAQSQSFRNVIVKMGLNPNSSWHWGFGAAGVGMTLGIIQYVLGQKRLAGVGGKPDIPAATEQTPTEVGVDYLTLVLALAGGAVGAGLGLFYGEARISALFPTVVGFFFGYLLGIIRHLKGEELRRVIVIFILFVFSILFWMTYEQAGSSLTLFADRLTRTTILGWTYPSSWFQSVPALFVIIFASIIGAVWLKLGDRQPSSPGKFTIGLFFAGLAFVVIAFAATLASGGRVSPMWLVLVYFLQTIGELCLSPVGLSTVTKLSPQRMVGLMLGVWFLSISIGSYIAGLATGLFAGNDNHALTRGFGIFAGITLAAALILAVLTPLIKRMTPRAQ